MNRRERLATKAPCLLVPLWRLAGNRLSARMSDHAPSRLALDVKMVLGFHGSSVGADTYLPVEEKVGESSKHG